MDEATKQYRAIVDAEASRIIQSIDCEKTVAIPSQLRLEIGRLRASPILENHETRWLALQKSNSPIAQSFRHTRLTNPGAELNEQNWAALILASDVRETVLARLNSRSFEDPNIWPCLLAWQQPTRLLADFADETPWCVVADWYEETGRSMEAKLCRQFAELSVSTGSRSDVA